jgi:hypothetical protein
MCEFKSAWVRRDGAIFESPYTDSHDEIAALHGLKDDRVFLSNLAKVEFRPPRNNDGVLQYLDLDNYTLVVDESETPIWFGDELRESVIERLRRIVESYIITDRRALVYGGMAIIADGAKIDNLDFVRAVICGGTVSAICGGTVSEIWGGTVSAICGGTVSAILGGTVSAIWGGTVSAIRGGTVSAIRGGTVSEIGKFAKVLADYREQASNDAKDAPKATDKAKPKRATKKATK